MRPSSRKSHHVSLILWSLKSWWSYSGFYFKETPNIQRGDTSEIICFQQTPNLARHQTLYPFLKFSLQENVLWSMGDKPISKKHISPSIAYSHPFKIIKSSCHGDSPAEPLSTSSLLAALYEMIWHQTNISHSKNRAGESIRYEFCSVQRWQTKKIEEETGSEVFFFLQLDSHLHTLRGSMFCKGRLLHGGSIWGWLIALSCQWCAQNSGILCICKYKQSQHSNLEQD